MCSPVLVPCSSSLALGSRTRARRRWRPSPTAACSCRRASTRHTAPSTTSSSAANPPPERQVCSLQPPFAPGLGPAWGGAALKLGFLVLGNISPVGACRGGPCLGFDCTEGALLQVWGFQGGGGAGADPQSLPSSPDPCSHPGDAPCSSLCPPRGTPGPAQGGRAVKSLPGSPIAGNSI